MKKGILILIVSLLITHVMGQVPLLLPAPAQSESILIKNVTVHVGDGTVIEKGAIGFDKGIITLVAKGPSDFNEADFDVIMDMSGKHIYPGLIEAGSIMGLEETEGVSQTTYSSDHAIDYRPHYRTISTYNAESVVHPTTRNNGVLIAQVAPRGGTLAGTSSIVHLDAWNWSDAVVKLDDGIILNWPGSYRGRVAPKKNTKYGAAVDNLKNIFTKAKSYSEVEHKEKDIRLEAMKGVFDGSLRLYIRVEQLEEIQDAVNFAKDYGVAKMVIIGGSDSYLVTDLLKENNIPVILNNATDLPKYADDDIDMRFKTPAILQKAGVKFCIYEYYTYDVRNLPFWAGMAAANGLTKEQALTSITLSVAEVLGIEDILGSLTVGKHATLFVSTGDALDIKSNNVEIAFIQGRNIDLNDRHKALYKHHMEKYKSKSEE